MYANEALTIIQWQGIENISKFSYKYIGGIGIF